MVIEITELAKKLAGSAADEKMTEELALIAAEMATDFKGTAEEFLKAVKERARTENPDFKFSSDGGHSIAQRVLKELIEGPAQPPAEKPAKLADQTVKTRVALNDKIVEYGGQFYDPVAKIWISGTKKKPQTVELTLFVQQKIGTGELIEIRS
jgi:hypothetical protein